MEIQKIGQAACAVYIQNEELAHRGIRPEDATGELLLPLLAPLLDRGGTARRYFVEIFPGKDALLVFLRPRSGRVEYFAFPDLEPLLAAVRACPDTLPSELFLLGDRYILAVSPWMGDDVPAALWEFGEPLPRPAGYLYHLREHGKKLLGPQASGALRRAFSPAPRR